MSKNPAILAIDQGTTSSRAIVFDQHGGVVSVARQEFDQLYPANGWVEHNPEDIWQTVLVTARKAFQQAEQKGYEVISIGITNQRETTLIWERDTLAAIYPAIVWQDRRTADLCKALKDAGHEDMVTQKTGLLLDPYFSASKIYWILNNVSDARERADRGELAFGTVDSYLIAQLTAGKTHATDATNASRTSLFDISTQKWDEELLSLFNVPVELLPEVKDSSADFGMTIESIFGRSIPINGVAGDQQAATVGQACFETGDIKSTYGTGCFAMLNTGKQIARSSNRLLSTVAYRLNGETTYALEGSIFMAGASVQWLRDEVQLIEHADETEALARSIENTDGVYLVPAFTGLGAPHWDPDARAALLGMTRDSGKAEIVRATLESVAYQTRDLLDAMRIDGVEIHRLRVDGGMIKNDWLAQFLSDILELSVDRPKVMETTAYGAAILAGLQSGIFNSLDDVSALWQAETSFTSEMSNSERENLIGGWQQAIQRVL
jgi:glycerol kinase